MRSIPSAPTCPNSRFSMSARFSGRAQSSNRGDPSSFFAPSSADSANESCPLLLRGCGALGVGGLQLRRRLERLLGRVQGFVHLGGQRGLCRRRGRLQVRRQERFHLARGVRLRQEAEGVHLLALGVELANPGAQRHRSRPPGRACRLAPSARGSPPRGGSRASAPGHRRGCPPLRAGPARRRAASRVWPGCESWP